MRESERQLNEAFDRVEAAFDRWDAAADRVERKLIMMPFFVIGLTVFTVLVSRFLA